MPVMIERGFAPLRIRVQPREDAELVIEPLLTAADSPVPAPDRAAAGDPADRTILPVSGFTQYLESVSEQRRPFLIFDQFEELVTLFDTRPAQKLQRRVTALIADLLHGPLRVKLLLAFRDDYLGKVKELLADCPELVDQALRLAPPSVRALPTIISGPFDRYPGHFAHPMPPALREKLVDALRTRFGAGEVSLSEVQTVCLRLWQSDTPEALLEQRGVQGLLEDYLGEAIDQMPQQLQGAAIALLSQMITDAGTRNVISAADLFQRVHEDESRHTPAVLRQALERLSQSRLVRRERRRDLDLYEITTEFLVPWISLRREEHRQRRERRRLVLVGSIAVALVLVAAGIAALAIWALAQRHHAQTEAAHAQTEATDALAADANSALGVNPAAALVISLAALAPYRAGPSSPTSALAATVQSLANAQSQGLTGILQRTSTPVHTVAFSPDGATLADATKTEVQLWDTANHTRLASLSTGSGNPVTGLAFSRSGATLAAATKDGAQLWDSANDRRLALLRTGSGDRVYSVAFSPDGRTLAAATDNGTVQLWNTASHTMLRSLLTGAQYPVNGVAFSPDGRTLAAATASGTVRLWDTDDDTVVTSLSAGRGNTVYSVAFSPNGRTLAAATLLGTVQLWDIARRKLLTSLPTGSGSAVTGVAFSRDGHTLAAGMNATVQLWDTATRTRLASFSAGSGNSVDGVAFSPDGGTLAAATHSGAGVCGTPLTAPRSQPARETPSPAWRSVQTAVRSPLPPTAGRCVCGTPPTTP